MMKVLHFIKRFFVAVISIAFVAFLAMCCLSGPVAEDGVTGTSYIGVPKISFASGVHSVDETSLTMTLAPGETELLESFTMLKSVDFSGSSCVDEIYKWSQANPKIDVRYTVPLANGQTVDNSVTSLDFSGIDSATLLACCEQLDLLPNIQSVDLGVDNDTELLSPEALSALSAVCPNAKVSYSFQLYGQTLDFESESIDLTGISREEFASSVSLLASTPKMKQITLGSAVDGSCQLTWEDLTLLSQTCPDAKLDYSFELYGQTLNFEAETLDFNHIEMTDGGAAVKQILPFMKNCTYLDMDSCGVSHEDMAAIRDAFPNIKVVWRVWFGDNYSVRTDVEKILASKPSVGGMLYDDSADVLKYCTYVKYLDLGHNTELGTLSYAASMPDLEVLIIAMTNITDLSPLANCSKLEYVEINSTQISDISVFADKTGLRHLNIAGCPNIYDISSLYGLTELERFWIGTQTPVGDDQVAAMRAAAPNCNVNDTTVDPHGEKWRFNYYDENIATYFWVPRHELLREQMGYNYQEYSFYWLDEKCGLEAPAQHAGKYGKAVYGL